MIKRSIDWLGGSLDAAGMAPMPIVGGVANGLNSALEFSRGNWRGGLVNAAMVPLGLFGLGGIGKGVEMGAKALPTLAKWAPKVFHGAEMVGKGLQKVPGAYGAFGNTREFAGEGMKYVAGQPLKNIGRAGMNTFMGGGKIVNPLIRSTAQSFAAGPGKGTLAEQGRAASQGAESGMQSLGNAVHNAFGSYGAQPPGSIGPHNAYLTGGM